MRLLTSTFCAPCSVLAAAVFAQRTAPPIAPTPDALAAAVEQLGDDRFDTRQRATETLWSAGDVARPLLERALGSDNAEVRLRARAILDRFTYGIYASTPADVVLLINRFRSGDTKQKADALKALAGQGAVQEVMRLLELEPNDACSQRKTARRTRAVGAAAL